MATSKTLITPSIVEIHGSSIRVGHPSIQGNVRTYLRSPIAASGTAMSVADNSSFADDDWMIAGNLGDATTEEVDVNGAVTLGTAMTVTNTLKFGHEIDAPVTKIYERGIRIYGASAVGAVGTLITSIDAITTPIADATPIQWDKAYTEYTLLSTDTAYAYYYVKFTDGTTDSAASKYIASSGVTYTSAQQFIQQALDITNTSLDENLITSEMCVRWVQDAQNAITQFTYQDPVTGNYKQKDWSWEVIADETSITLTENENEYSLSLLAATPKYVNSQKAIVDMRIGARSPLKPRSVDELDAFFAYKPKTTVATQATAGQTSIVLTDVSEFSDSGTIMVGQDQVVYTARSTSTNTLSGIPASGTGSITATHAVGASVWQNITAALPTSYTIFNGTIKLDRPIPSDFVGQKLKLRYLYAIPRITLASDVTVIPFTNVFQHYLAAQMERRKGNDEKYASFMDTFMKQVLSNALADMVQVNDQWVYHNYYDNFLFDGLNLNNSYYYYNTF